MCVCCESKIVSIAVERFWTGVIWDSCKLKVYISFQSTSIMKYYINKYIHLPLFICVLGNWILFAKHKTVFHVASTDCIQSAAYRIVSSAQLFCPLQCHPFIGNLPLFKPVQVPPRLRSTWHHTIPHPPSFHTLRQQPALCILSPPLGTHPQASERETTR